MVFWLAGAASAADTKVESFQEYYLSFQGNPANSTGFKLLGPNAEECVRFEPDGLRLRLPPGQRPNTGLATGILVKGDFEITVDFEVLQEPNPAGGSDRQTRFGLNVVLDKPGLGQASFSRTVFGKGIQFSIWLSLHEVAGQAQQRRRYVPTEGKAARLRLVRSGSVLSYYGSAGPTKDFALLQEYPFSAEDLKDVRLVGSTGEANASLDVRVSDLHIRAESLPNVPGLPTTSLPRSGGKGWLAVAGILGLAFPFVLGGWLYLRQRRRAAKTSERASVAHQRAKPSAATPMTTFPCAACGKSLKAKAEWAGKKLKCPQYG